MDAEFRERLPTEIICGVHFVGTHFLKFSSHQIIMILGNDVFADQKHCSGIYGSRYPHDFHDIEK